MKTVKIKGNQYAELVAQLTDEGEPFFLNTESRLNTTQFGELFISLMREGMRSGAFSSPVKLVEYCEIVVNRAILTMADNPALAIEAPPRSAINRKVAKAKAQKEAGNA